MVAVLTVPVDSEELVKGLVQRQQERPTCPELNWANNIKIARTTFLKAAEEARAALDEGSRTYTDFLTSFACEIQNHENGQLEPTAFYMTSGRQEFLKEVRTLAKNLATGIKIGRRKKTTAELFHKALFGPWRDADPQHSLGWDPTTERLHALRAKSPTKEASEGVTAAVWLAFEALPLFPCFYSEGRLATTGFHREGKTRQDRVTYLTWPVWAEPISLDTMRSLVSLEELRSRGIAAVFRSERYKVKTQGAYYILRPACPCV